MNKLEFKANLLEKIKSLKNFSFLELSRMEGAKGDITVKEETIMGTAVFWTELSEIAALSVLELFNEGKIEFDPTNLVTYLEIGSRPNLPIFTNKKSNKRRWMPVVINLKNRSGE